MTDAVDLASEREQYDTALALTLQLAAAGLEGKTVDDSAEYCEMGDCGVAIPSERREAAPGCRYCVECQERVEKHPQWRLR